MIVTTTNLIENAKIEQYLGIVSANCVVGTNVISDFVASFTDFFGGMSNTYQRKLQVLYDAAMATLKENARKKGANAIVGVGIDFDEVAGKGKSMFMVSVIGTAVKIEEDPNQSNALLLETLISDGVSGMLVENHVARKKLVNKISSLEAGQYPTESEIAKIIELEIDEVVDVICEKYIEARISPYDTSGFRSLFGQYLLRIGYEKVIEPIYACFEKSPSIISKIINEYSLFCPEKVVKMLPSLTKEDIISLIQSEKETYYQMDIAPMEEIVDYLNKFPDEGQISEVSSLLGGRSKKYICHCGHKNPIEKEFCALCGKNIKGLTEFEVGVVNDFKLKVEFLKTEFNK